jgi:carbon-monoxide dehydrogenase large subunit
MGEGGTIGAPAAIANAVSDALGVDFDSVPIRPEQVLGAVEA